MHSSLFESPPATGETTEQRVARELEAMAYHPDDVPSEDSDEYEAVRGAESAFKVSKKRKAQPNHHGRALALLEQMHPGSMLYVCEKRVTIYSGMVVKVDQWGFMDICGITAKGAWISANVTTKANMAAHMREYTNPSNTHGQAKTPVIQLIEGYLSRRGVFYVIGYDKPGRFWESTVWTVDQTLLDEYKARKRRV